MAIISPGWTECSICGEILWPDEEYVATSHFIGDREDPLYRFSDTGMHRRCYDGWEHRVEFTRRYGGALRELSRDKPDCGSLDWPGERRPPPPAGPIRSAASERLELRGVSWMRQHGVESRVVEDVTPLVAAHGVLLADFGDPRPVQSGTFVLGVHDSLAAHLGAPTEQFLEEFAGTVTIAPIQMLKALVDAGSRGIVLTRLSAPPEQIEPMSERTYFELVRDSRSAALWAGLLSSMRLAFYMNRPFPATLHALRPGQPRPLTLSYFLPRGYARSPIRIPLEERRQSVHVALHHDHGNWSRARDARLVLAVHATQMSEPLQQLLATCLTIAPVEQLVHLVRLSLPGIAYAPLPAVPSGLPFDAKAAYFELDRSGDLFAALADSKAVAVYAGGAPELRLELFALRQETV